MHLKLFYRNSAQVTAQRGSKNINKKNGRSKDLRRVNEG